MKRLLLAAALALFAACSADAPTDEDLQSEAEATQCFAWPHTVLVQPRVYDNGWNGIIWSSSVYSDGFAFASSAGQYGYYVWQGQSHSTVTATVSASSCSPNYAAPGYNGFFCDGTYIMCPYVDHASPIASVFYGTNGCGYYSNQWYAGSTFNGHVSQGGNGEWCVSSDSNYPGGYGAVSVNSAGPGKWSITCGCPSGGTISVSTP